MAGGKALNVRMNFQVDTTQAQQQLKGLYSQLNQITSASAFGKNSQLGITSQILEATKAAGQLKTALAEAVNPLTGNLNLTKFNDQLRMSGMSLNQYRNELSALGTTGNQAFNSLARTIMTAEAPMLRVGKAASTMWTVLGNTLRWQATSSMLHGIMNTASNAMSYVKSLDSSLNHIRIVTGQSQEQMAQFAKTANQAAKALNTSTNEYAKASLIYYQQGLSNKQVEERTKATIKLANVAGQSAKTVSDEMTAVWNNFYDGSKSLEYYADVITALGATTASSSEEIAKGLQKFSSIAKTTGLSYEYATSALSTVVAATRQSADSVGTSFKTLFSRLQGLSLGETLDDGTTLNKYSKALDVVGVNIKKANGDLKDMDTILDEIGSKWTKLSQDEKIALAQTVGGVRNYTGLMSLMDNWDDFQKNLKTAQDAQGTLQIQADIYAQSWAAASKHVQAAAETIYSNLLDDKFFKGLTNGFGSVLDVIGEMTNSLGGFKGSMVTLANGALQLFRPQITEGLGNLGLNIRSIFKGRQDIINLRTEAQQALLSPIQFSRYGQVNDIQQQMNNGLVQRQTLYNDLVTQGKIPQYLQPTYQMMFNAANAQSDQAIQATEAALMQAEDQHFKEIQTRQAITYATRQESDRLKGLLTTSDKNYVSLLASGDKNYLALQQAAQSGNPIIAMQAQQMLQKYPTSSAAAEAYLSHQDYLKSGGISDILGTGFSEYAKQYRAAGVASTLETLTKRNLSEISDDDARRAASYITQMVSGSKALGLNFQDTLPAIHQINDEIMTYQKQLEEGTITQDEFNKKVAVSIREHSTLGDEITKYTGANSTILEQTRQALIDQAITATGVEKGSIKAQELESSIRSTLGSSELSEMQKLDAMRKLGISDETTKNLVALLNGQGNQSPTISMAGALTSSINAVASLGQVIYSIHGAYETFQNDNATTTQKIGAMSSAAMSLGMAIKPTSDLIQHFGDKVTFLGKTTQLTNGMVGLAIAAITTLGIVGARAYKDWAQENKLENIVNHYSQSVATATQLTSEAQQSYENLVTARGTHNKLLDDLLDLQQGTYEFTSALLSANTTAQELIDNYDLLYEKDYTYGKYGQIIFNQASLDAAIKTAEETALNRSVSESQLKSMRSIISTYNDAINTSPGKISNINDNLQFLNQTYLGERSGLNTTLISALQSWIMYESQQNFSDVFKERFNTENPLEQLFPQYSQEALQELTTNIAQIVGTDEQGRFDNSIKTLEDLSVYKLAELSKLIYGQDSEYVLKQQSYAQSIIQSELSRNQQLNRTQAELAAIEATEKMSPEDFYAIGIAAQHLTQTSWLEEHTPGRSLADMYEAFIGEKPAEGIDKSQMQTEIEEKFFELAYSAPEQLTKIINTIDQSGKLLEKLGIDTLSKVNIGEIGKELEGLELPDLYNLAFGDIDEAFNKVKTGKDQQTINAIDKYKEHAQQLFINQFSDLQDAILLSFTDSAIESATQQAFDTNSGAIQVAAANIAEGLTYGTLKQAVSAMTNANTVGAGTGQLMRSILADSHNKNGLGGYNEDVLAVIRNYNYDNSIGGLYANNQLAKFAQNQRQRDMYQNLLASQIKDMQEEKGFFMALYNSSGFSDVMESLNEQFQQTGQITAQNVTDLAAKSEVLSQALKFSADNASRININAGGIAGILSEINKGTISANQVSSGLISAMSTAKSTDAANAAAFESVDNQQLGRSASDLLDYFQAPAKEYYNIRKQGWGFYSEPMQNMIRMFGGADVQNAYIKANQNTNLKTSELFDQLPKYYTDFMYTMAGVSGKGKNKKAKGGGGPEDVWGFVYDALNANKDALKDAGFGEFGTDEFWDNLGFRADANGNFYQRGEATLDEAKAKLEEAFKAIGWDAEGAKEFVNVAYGFPGNSGQTGYKYKQNAANQAYKKLTKEESPQTLEQLRAFFNENAAFLPYGTGDKGFQKFLTAYRKDGGNVGYSKKEKEEWNITTAEDLVNAAGEVGTKYDQITYLGKPPGAPAQYRNEGLTKVTDMKGLGAAYGAYDQKTGSWDYNKLVNMITSMGGTEADLITLMENSKDAFGGTIYGKDRYGRTIEMGSDTVKQFSEKINAATGAEIVANRVEAYGGNTTAAAYWRNPNTGELELDSDGEGEAKYNRDAANALSKKSANQEAAKVGDYSFLSNDEMNSAITSTAEKLQQKKDAGEQLTAGQQQFLDLYNNNDRDATTNKLLTQILYNTDTVVDQNGELVEYAGATDEQKRNAVKKGENGEDVVTNDQDEELNMPTKEPEPTGGGGAGTGWDGGGGKGGGFGKWQVFGVDDNNQPIIGRINSSTGEVQIKGEENNQQGGNSGSAPGANTGGSKASGQNNYLLRFASGKPGHIAVTGELGPELRIKDDGSADILGKKGREYTWVEPTDRIYTASQTASILGKNNIAAFEGLAKGIRNYLPAYGGGARAGEVGADWNRTSSSSNKGGVGGGTGGAEEKKDPRYDPNTLKIRDVLERYYTILQKIEDITRAVERFSKVAERAWGKDRIKAIEKQTELYKEQYNAQKKYVSEIGEYLNTDEEALTTMIQEFVDGYNDGKADIDKLTWTGAQFDSNGVLTNYRDFVEKLVAQYNEKAEENAKDKEAQYKFQEQLKDIQFYTETLNTYETETDKLIDLANQIIDNSLKEITYRVEYELELNNDLERILNFKTDLVKDNVFKTAEYLALLDKEMEVTADNLSTIQQGVYDYLGTLAGENMRNGKEYSLTDLGIATTKEVNVSERELDYTKITDQLDNWIEELGKTDATTAKKIKDAIQRNSDTKNIENYREIFNQLHEANSGYTEKALGLTKLSDAEIDYDKIDFKKVTKNLDKWITELHNKTKDEFGKSAIADEVRAIIKRDADGLITNYREVFDKINAMNQRLSADSIELLKTNVQEFFNELSSLKDNPTWSGLSTDQKDQLTNYMEQTITELNKLRDNFKDTIESLGDSLKDMNRKIGNEIDEFDYYGDVYKNFLGIINLTNRHMTDISSDFFKNLNSKVFDNNINKIKATNTNLKLQTANLAEVNEQYEAMIARRNAANASGDIQMADFYQEQADLLKDQLDIANKAYEDAMTDFQHAWEDALEGAKNAYTDALQEASRSFEDSFSPFFHTLELLEAQYAREKALEDLYVDDYNRIHDLSKLNRDIENSILDTNNLKSKERLRDLQKEINDLQENGAELSEYDLNILDKKYKLELARQALEDARDAKSLVRLSRDNNGNWGYIYTSNEDDVATAEQQYEDAIREMEEANQNYIDSLQDQMLQVQKDAQQALQTLKPEDFDTMDDYWAAVQNIYDGLAQQMEFLTSQMQNALGNNDYLDPFIQDRYGINDHNLTTDYEDTPLAKLMGVDSLDQMLNDALTRFVNMGIEATEAWKTYQQEQEKIFDAADHDITHIGEQFTSEMQRVAAESEEQVNEVEDLADRIQEAFADTAQQVTNITDKWADSVKELTDEYSLLLEVITELKRLDGEYVEPTKMINADEAIDSWKEISDFKKNLAANGVMSLITTGENGQEFADTYIAGSAAATKFIHGAMEKAARADGVFNFDDSSDPLGDYSKLITYLKRRGIAIYKWKGEEHIAWSEDDEDLKKLKEALDAMKKSDNYIGVPGASGIPWGWIMLPGGSFGKLDNPSNPGGSYTGPYNISGGLAGCFAPGTQVLMADGTTKNIELVQIGDYVISYNEETHEFIPKRVKESYPHYNTPRLIRLTFNNGIVLELTPGHPLYSLNNGWKSLDIENSLYEHKTIATLLQLNDTIVGVNDTLAILVAIDELDIGNNYTSYNIEIEDCHTFIANGLVAHNSGKKPADTGGYTGRWSAESGGYTGEWPMGSVRANGRWALLHQKELILNAHDTENFLDAMEIVRQLDNLTNWMANGLGDLFVPNIKGEKGELEQNVKIEASFPNVKDHQEIEMAFDNLVNRASQYANRK